MVLYTFFHFFVKIKTLYYPVITDVLWTKRKEIILHRVQSTRVSLQSSELGPPPPYHVSECLPHLGPMGEDTRLRERGGDTIPKLDRKSGTLYSIIPLLDCSWLTVSTKTAALKKFLYIEASMNFEFVK